MADEPENTEEELLLTDEVEQEALEAAESETAEDEEEEILTFGDEPTEVHETENATIRHMREELKKLRKEVAAKKPAEEDKPIEVGEKPKIADFDYDEDRYSEAMDAYYERKAAAEKQAASKSQASDEETKAWQAELARVEQESVQLARADYGDAFETVLTTLGQTRVSAIVKATKKTGNTAKMIYALARDPDRLATFAAQPDLVEFIADIAELRGKLQMVKRRKAPDPDVPQCGSAKVSGSSGSNQKRLAKLHEEAQETGDYSKYYALKRDLGK